MREIKFRGKSITPDNEGYIKIGTWVYGCLKKFNQETYESKDNKYSIHWHIIYCTEVDIESIGQYTSLKDKKGKEIYEGDIVDLGSRDIYEVKFINGCWILYYCGKFNLTKSYFLNEFASDCEVVGNIYENPELLK